LLSVSPHATDSSVLCCGGCCADAAASPPDWRDRARICRERALEARRNAASAAISDICRSWLQIGRDWDAAAAQAEAFARVAPAVTPGPAPRCFCAALFAMRESGDPEDEQEGRHLCAMR